MRTQKKINKQNKTRTKRVLINSPNYYFKYFVNTKMLPSSEIFKTIYNGYNNYKKIKNAKENALVLEDCLLFKKNFLHKERKKSIKTSAGQNPKCSLNKLLSYAFYIKMPYAFENEKGTKRSYNEFIEIIKYQMGKDISRDSRIINGERIDYRNDVSEENNYSIADKLCLKLIQTYFNVYKLIDYNKINIIMLMSCQNIFNLISDMITLKLNEILEPEINSVFRPKKIMNVIIKKETQIVSLSFSSQLIISNNQGQYIDPEYPCGNLKFQFNINLLKNTFFMPNFELVYNLEKCSNEEMQIEKQPVEKSTNKFKKEYAVPVVTGLGMILATPFLLPLL